MRIRIAGLALLLPLIIVTPASATRLAGEFMSSA